MLFYRISASLPRRMYTDKRTNVIIAHIDLHLICSVSLYAAYRYYWPNFNAPPPRDLIYRGPSQVLTKASDGEINPSWQAASAFSGANVRDFLPRPSPRGGSSCARGKAEASLADPLSCLLWSVRYRSLIEPLTRQHSHDVQIRRAAA